MIWTARALRRSICLPAAAVTVLAGCGPQAPPHTPNEAERVQGAFARMSKDVAQKDGITPTKLAAKRAGATLFPDGTKATLWVTGSTSSQVRSRCFYVDVTLNRSAATAGQSGCGQPTNVVALTRVGAIVIGDVGSWPARTARLFGAGNTVDFPVTNGYFLVSGDLSAGSDKTFRIALLNEAGVSLGTVTGLQAPGSHTLR